MKQKEVQIGGVYVAKVSGKTAKVLIVREHVQSSGRMGWYGRNLATGREVFIRSAARLRQRLDPAAEVLRHGANRADAEAPSDIETRLSPTTPMA